MNAEKIGKLIAQLRKEQGMTQKELADLLYLSDRTISKWERGAGIPDVSVWRDLAEVLNTTVPALMQGEKIINPRHGGNMKRTQFYVCPQCGNILTSAAKAQITCCGQPLTALEAKPEDEVHTICTQEMDGEQFVSMEHEMTKEHFVSFFAYVNGDKMYVNRLYPEGAAQARFPRMPMGMLYAYCTKDGLYRKIIHRKK